MTPPEARRTTFHELTVAAVDELTEHARAITLDCPPELAEQFRFRPGQHLTVRRTIDGVSVRRSYSLCSLPPTTAEPPTLRIAVAHVPGGAMSTALTTNVQVGDRLEVLPPLGNFTCPTRADRARHHVAFAAGSGITPILSLLGTALRDEPHSRATLVLGNRSAGTVMLREELADLKDRYPDRFQLVHVLSREDLGVELLSGRLDADRIRRILAGLVDVAGVDQWYLCGPLGMVEAAAGVLAEQGVDPDHVHHEIFHTDTVAARAPVLDESARPQAVVTLTLDGRRSRVAMPSRAETILAALLRARPDAPYSCTGGMCGTCRARVVSGEVTMTTCYALDRQEIADGFVLTCQAHPVSDEVTLDFG